MTNISLLRAKDFQVSDWSGGKTKQLYLSPQTGHYGKREFDYRLSTATVELAESQFSDHSDHYQGQMIAISNGQELSRDDEIQFIYALGDLTVTGTNLPALNLEAEQLLIVEKETQETELHIMFSSNQPKGAPLAIWAGLTHIPTK